MNLLQLLIGAIILYMVHKFLKNMIKSFKERKELDSLFLKS